MQSLSYAQVWIWIPKDLGNLFPAYSRIIQWSRVGYSLSNNYEGCLGLEQTSKEWQTTAPFKVANGTFSRS